jgi:hypothetical protein
MSGYIKLYRGWGENDAFRDATFCQRAAWVWLLEKAAWKDTHRRDPHGNIVMVKRGQLHTSTRTLGATWGWSKNKAERFLRDLENCQMLDRQTDRHGVMLTITNYEKYQGERTKDGPRSGTVADQSRTTQEEGKERKEDKNKARARPDDVSSQVWSDYLKLRTRKRAPLTATALAGLRSQAEKAGWSLEDALAESVTRGWTGFKADWVKGKSGKEEEFTGPC